MANIVDDLNLFVAQEQYRYSSVVYFFICHDLYASMEARTIIGAIVRQLLGMKHGLADATEHDHSSLCVEDMLQLLIHSTPPLQKTYLILDGLDL